MTSQNKADKELIGELLKTNLNYATELFDTLAEKGVLTRKVTELEAELAKSNQT